MLNEWGVEVGTRVTSENHPENRSAAPTTFGRDHLEAYLSLVLDVPVEVKSISPLKERGPVRIDYEVGGVRRTAILELRNLDVVGPEYRPVHGQDLVRSPKALRPIPRHARTLGVAGIEVAGGFVPVDGAKAQYVLTEYAEGHAYGEDLVRLKLGGLPTRRDRDRAEALAEQLAEIHQQPGPDPRLYVQRIRELLGQADGIMGLLDSFPPQEGLLIPELLEHLEHRCLKWRWRLKGRTDRLRRVHGEFHPWNILFREGTEYTILDRSRIAWGEPADDAACLTMNYLVCALQTQGESRESLFDLFHRFWSRYLEKSGDTGILDVAAPFLVRHALALVSPVWHPELKATVRRSLFSFMFRVLEAPSFDPDRVEKLLRDD